MPHSSNCKSRYTKFQAADEEEYNISGKRETSRDATFQNLSRNRIFIFLQHFYALYLSLSPSPSISSGSYKHTENFSLCFFSYFFFFIPFFRLMIIFRFILCAHDKVKSSRFCYRLLHQINLKTHTNTQWKISETDIYALREKES